MPSCGCGGSSTWFPSSSFFTTPAAAAAAAQQNALQKHKPGKKHSSMMKIILAALQASGDAFSVVFEGGTTPIELTDLSSFDADYGVALNSGGHACCFSIDDLESLTVSCFSFFFKFIPIFFRAG